MRYYSKKYLPMNSYCSYSPHFCQGIDLPYQFFPHNIIKMITNNFAYTPEKKQVATLERTQLQVSWRQIKLIQVNREDYKLKSISQTTYA